jgi:DNA-directed RNA polymerase specialized sigma24 family protein
MAEDGSRTYGRQVIVPRKTREGTFLKVFYSGLTHSPTYSSDTTNFMTQSRRADALSDQEIIVAWRHQFDDPVRHRAFDQLIEQYTELLCGLIEKRIPESDVDDILQDTLISAWKRAEIPADLTPKVFLCTIASRRCSDYWRRQYCGSRKTVFENVEDYINTQVGTEVAKQLSEAPTGQDLETFLVMLADALDEIIRSSRGLKKLAGQTARSAGFPKQSDLWPSGKANVGEICKKIEENTGEPANELSVKSGLQQIRKAAQEKLRKWKGEIEK